MTEPAGPPPASRFPVPAREDLDPALRERYAEVEERSGFLPNVFAALAWRPAEAQGFFALHDALMDKETPALSRADRELVVVATSAANDCLYCVVAHGAIARIRARDPYLADQRKDLRPPGARELAPGPCRRPERWRSTRPR
ncbi:peroxidase-related enzyme [Blastococcus sp. SYSU D00813]